MPKKTWRRELVEAAAVGCIVATTFAHGAFAESTFNFNMQQQPLSVALREYARVSGQQIIFTDEIVAGRNAPALHGAYTPADALARLLDGTGLKTERATSGAIMVKSASASSSASASKPQGDEPAASQQERPASNSFRMAAATTTTQTTAAAGSNHNPTIGIEEIIVTAQKRQENINDVGMSITALSGDQLANYGIRSPEDLGDGVVGLSYSRLPSGPPVFSIRGIGFPEVITAGAPGVSTYVDEVPLPYSLMSIGAALDVQRVEVLKGPQGTLYGQNVTGGAINFIANRPTDEFATGLNFGYGSYQQLNASAYISGPLGGNFKARVSAAYDHIGDWQQSYTRNDERGAGRVFMARALLDWQPTDKLTVQFNINGWNDKSDEPAAQLIGITSPFSPLAPAARQYPLPPTDARHADWNPGTPLGAVDPITGAVNDSFSRDNDFLQLSTRVDWKAFDSATLTSLTAWQELDQQSLADVDGTNVNNWNTGSGASIDVFSQELRLAGEMGRLDWLVGANFMHEHIYNYASVFSDVGFFPFDATASIGRTRGDTYAAFTHLEYALTDTLSVLAGVRYTDVRLHNESCSYDGDGIYAAMVRGIAASRGVLINVPRGGCVTLNPVTFQPGIVVNDLDETNVPFKVGVNWKVMSNSLLYASVSRGYKTGGFTLSGATFAPGFDPAVQESVLAYEGGFKFGLIDNRLQLNGAAYYYDYKDKQVRGRYNDPLAGTLNRLINIPKSKITGGELQVTAVPDNHWRINLGAAYTESKIRDNFTNLDAMGVYRNLDGTMLPFTPKWQLLGDVEYGFAVGATVNAFVGAHAKYQSESYSGLGENAILKIDGYTNLDLRLGLRSQDERWSVAAFVDNATDKYSWKAASLAGTDAITRTANLPRMYGIRFSIRK